MERCIKCLVDKSRNQFYRCAQRKNGLQAYCKECSHKAQSIWTKANRPSQRAEIIAYKKAWRELNLERVRKRDKLYRITNRERLLAEKRTWYKHNREKMLLQFRNRYRANRDRILAGMRAYYRIHADRIKERVRQWASANPDLVREINKTKRTKKPELYKAIQKSSYDRYRARRARASIIEPVDRQVVIKRDRSICHICHKLVRSRDIVLDHLIPLSMNGPHTEWNLAVAHRICNAKRGTGRLPAQLLLSFSLKQ